MNCSWEKWEPWQTQLRWRMYGCPINSSLKIQNFKANSKILQWVSAADNERSHVQKCFYCTFILQAVMSRSSIKGSQVLNSSIFWTLNFRMALKVTIQLSQTLSETFHIFLLMQWFKTLNSNCQVGNRLYGHCRWQLLWEKPETAASDFLWHAPVDCRGLYTDSKQQVSHWFWQRVPCWKRSVSKTWGCMALEC